MKPLNYIMNTTGIVLISLFIAFAVTMADKKGIFTDSLNMNKDILMFSLLLVLTLFVITVLVRKNKSIYKIVYTGLILRLLALVAIGIFGLLPYSFEQWDDISRMLLNDWNSGHIHIDFEASGNVKYYTILTTAVYFVFGYNPLFMLLLNVVFGTITIIVIYHIAKLLFTEKVAIRASWIMALWPTHIMFSAMHMRDSLSTLLMSLFILQLILCFKKMQFSTIFWLFLLFIGNTLIRSQNAGLLVAAVSPFILYFVWKKSHKYLLPINIMIVLAVVLTVAFLIFATGNGSNINIDYVIKEMDYRTDGGTAYLTNMSYSTWFDVLIYSPIRLYYFLFTPFPWRVSNISQVLASVESMVIMLMTIKIILKRKSIFNMSNRRILLLTFITICILGLVANAIIDSNVGTAMRHKLQYIYLFFILYAASVQKNEDVNLPTLNTVTIK